MFFFFLRKHKLLTAIEPPHSFPGERCTFKNHMKDGIILNRCAISMIFLFLRPMIHSVAEAYIGSAVCSVNSLTLTSKIGMPKPHGMVVVSLEHQPIISWIGQLD